MPKIFMLFSVTFLFICLNLFRMNFSFIYKYYILPYFFNFSFFNWCYYCSIYEVMLLAEKWKIVEGSLQSFLCLGKPDTVDNTCEIIYIDELDVSRNECCILSYTDFSWALGRCLWESLVWLCHN